MLGTGRCLFSMPLRGSPAAWPLSRCSHVRISRRPLHLCMCDYVLRRGSAALNAPAPADVTPPRRDIPGGWGWDRAGHRQQALRLPWCPAHSPYRALLASGGPFGKVMTGREACLAGRVPARDICHRVADYGAAATPSLLILHIDSELPALSMPIHSFLPFGIICPARDLALGACDWR